MGGPSPPINPFKQFLFDFAMGDNPIDKMGKGIKGIQSDAKAIKDLPTELSKLNNTLTHTNVILQAFLDKFG